MRIFLTSIGLALLSLSGCDNSALIDKLMPKEEAQFAKEYIALYPQGKIDEILQKSDPNALNAQNVDVLKQIAGFFPPEKPIEIKLLGSNTIKSSSGAAYNFAFQYHYPSKWLQVDVGLTKAHGQLLATGIYVQPLNESLEVSNKFSLQDKTWKHYSMFGTAITLPLFVLYALVLCIRTPIPKRKWLWIIFILIGVPTLSLNWTTGEFWLDPLRFLLFSAAYWMPSPSAAVIIQISLPIGAIVFLYKRKKLVEPLPNKTPNNPAYH